jgi:NAD(P)-dependent dehydrogenase (short-subunit alcohol dehydrogenase family)
MDAGRLEQLHALLREASSLVVNSPEHLALERAVAHLAKSAKKQRRLGRKQASRAHDVAVLRAEAPVEVLRRFRSCYVCKAPYQHPSSKNPQVCLPCAAHAESAQRSPLDLAGRRALITGARVKIGYAVALRMLRAGAEVHITTRFPLDALKRYSSESDAHAWAGRLHVHELDFRDLGRLNAVLAGWSEGPSYDIVINNAAQSVWHPPEYYHALVHGERESPPTEMHDIHMSRLGAEQLALGHGGTLPLMHVAQLQDMRSMFSTMDTHREDSWVRSLGDISAVDMVEAQVVNGIAPFLICNALRNNMKQSTFASRFIVNVSAVEGQFSRADKPSRHPHTNMAKAALNMLTRTAADDLAGHAIYMVSVDPGWASKEGKHVQPGFVTPISVDDAAARVLHPIAEGLAGDPIYGVLLKDYKRAPW